MRPIKWSYAIVYNFAWKFKICEFVLTIMWQKFYFMLYLLDGAKIYTIAQSHLISAYYNNILKVL